MADTRSSLRTGPVLLTFALLALAACGDGDDGAAAMDCLLQVEPDRSSDPVSLSIDEEGEARILLPPYEADVVVSESEGDMMAVGISVFVSGGADDSARELVATTETRIADGAASGELIIAGTAGASGDILRWKCDAA